MPTINALMFGFGIGWMCGICYCIWLDEMRKRRDSHDAGQAS